jgi:mxaJ protein
MRWHGAIVWGPLAGYFAQQSKVRLRLEPVTPQLDDGHWPMAYDISVGVRRDDIALREQIESFLEKGSAAITTLLDAYHIPQTSGPSR